MHRAKWLIGISLGALSTTLILGGLAVAQSPTPKLIPEDSSTFFETKIRPLLSAKCYSCHSAASQPIQGGLRLDSREELIKGGKSGSALRSVARRTDVG